MKYSVLVVDPPWAPRDGLPGETRGADKQYPVISTPDLVSRRGFELAEAADDSILFLWRLASMQSDALAVISAWGFDLKSELVWEKITPTGKPHFGMGHYVRAGHETCLIAARGRAASRVIQCHSVRSVLRAPCPRYDAQHPKVLSGRAKAGAVIHSAKPDEFYAEVEKMCRGPYWEGFARRRRTGWDCMGNEAT